MIAATPGTTAALACWAATAVGLVAASSGRAHLGAAAVLLAGVAAAVVLRGRRRIVLALLVLGLAGVAVAAVRVAPLTSGPLATGGEVSAVARTTAEPQRRAESAAGPRASVGGWRIDAETVELGSATSARSVMLPVLLLVDGEAPRAGATLRLRGRALGPDPLRGNASVIVVTEWDLVAGPGAGHRAASLVRDGLRAALRDRPPDAAGLLPGLVLGDTSAQPDDLEAAMRDSGLAHLTAVSGGNVAVIVLLVVALGRAVGLRRGPGQLALVAVGVAAYVGLVGPEPSVLRAAAMTGAALLGLAADARLPGLDPVGWPVVLLLLLDPFLALSIGFAMSVLATAALLLAVRRTRRAPPAEHPLRRAGRVLALALVLTAAAQLAVAPLVAGIGGGIPVGGLVANLLAAPAVVPATALGVLAGVLGALATPLGTAVALPASWSAGWIAATARACAEHLPVIPWPDGIGGAAGLMAVLFVAAGALWLAPTARVRAVVSAVLVVATLLVLRPVPTAAPWADAPWPPPGWVLVACDVGQGTALVLAAGDGSAVVVDAGPDATELRRCLGRLGVRRVPLVVLSHFHADHVDGLRALLGLGVTTVVVSPLDEPRDRASRVRRLLEEAGVAVHVAGPRERWTSGAVRLEVVWPTRLIRGEGSDPNNASVTLHGRVGEVSVVLGGDLEPAAQSAALATGELGPVDVVAVPHHGSRRQSPSWATTLRPRIALFTVGRDNDYGHPAPATLEAYSTLGAAIGRTDRDGDVAVVVLPDTTLALARRGVA